MKLVLLIIIAFFYSFLQAQGKQSPAFDDSSLHQVVLFSSDMSDDVSCYRIPSIVTAPNGDLIAAIDERVPSCGDLKWSRDINIVMRRSSDNGNNWSEIERIVDFPPGRSASDPSMIVDKISGAVFLFYNYMDLDSEKDVYYLHVIKSNDNGRTWSKAEDITSQISKAEWHHDFKFITSGRGIQTRDGKLLHCLVNLDHGMHLFGTNDHGKSWFLYDNAIEPANESKIVELSDGRWMINSRTNDPGLRYVHVSEDEGLSWLSYPDSSLIDPSCNASIIRYDHPTENRESCLIFSNAASLKRENMTIRLSYDDGVTWSEGKTIYPGSSAYSSLCILDNGDIGLFFEKDDYSENVFVRIPFNYLSEDQ